MDEQVKNFKDLLNSSNKILITSHISPDPDAISSALLLGRVLKENYPDKTVEMVLEEKPNEDLSFLEGYDQLNFESIYKKLEELKPELLIIVDANIFHRVSRLDWPKVQEYIKQNKVKTVIIDHHEPDSSYMPDILINNRRPATAEEIFVLCFEGLGLRQPVKYAETALLGIVSDTQRHRFDHPGYRETYRVVSELIDAGASIERLEAKLERYSKDELQALSNLAANVVDSGQGYTYSFIDDEFKQMWLERQKSTVDLKNACEEFTNRYARSLENNQWGFVVYPDYASGAEVWGVSLRSISGVKDVSAIAKRLGGGGHKPAAGAKFEAKNANEAVQKVINAISGAVDED